MKRLGPLKRFLPRLAFSLLAFLVCLELVLQAAALTVGSLRPPPALRHPGAPVILCVGDSHTYGFLLPEEDSYPSRLQALLDRDGWRANVVNAGIPGENTSQLRRRIVELLAWYRPVVVIVQSSSNNDWNRQDVLWSDLEDGAVEPGLGTRLRGAWYWARGSIRSIKLAAFVYHEYLREMKNPKERAVDRRGNVAFHEWRAHQTKWDSVETVSRRTRGDLAQIVLLCREQGAAPVLLNYVGQPVGSMGLANELIQSVAEIYSVPLIDNDSVIRPLFWGPDDRIDWAVRDRLSLPAHDETHLAGPGNQLVAENIQKRLGEFGLLDRLGPHAR